MTKTENTVRSFELVCDGQYVAEVEVALIETDSEWSPYLSLADAERLEGLRSALRRGDLNAAAMLGKVNKLTPVAAK